MPAKNRIKPYLENGYYHLYNRGNDKKPIFLDYQDYRVFLTYLKEYLVPKDEKQLYEKLSKPDITPKEREKVLKLLRLNNFADEITLISHQLMPNHFHLQLKQKQPNSIDKFMNSIGTRYSMYFNIKYQRVGSLYQGVYKGVLLETNEQFLNLSKYIHKQGLVLPGRTLHDERSSYAEYLGLRRTEWVHPEEILSFFSNKFPNLSYQSFVEEADDIVLLQNIIIEQLEDV